MKQLIQLISFLKRLLTSLKDHLVKNKIFYYPTFTMSEMRWHLSKIRLLEKLGVDVVFHRQTTDIETGKPCYDSIYREQLDHLKSNL